MGLDSLIQDPDFQSKPWAARLDMLKQASPDFNAKSPNDQAQMMVDMKKQPWWQGGGTPQVNTTPPANENGYLVVQPGGNGGNQDNYLNQSVAEKMDNSKASWSPDMLHAALNPNKLDQAITGGTNLVNKAISPAGYTVNPNDVLNYLKNTPKDGNFLTNLPHSIANTAYGLANSLGAPYEGLSKEAIDASFPGGNPSPQVQQELNQHTWNFAKGLAAPFGLAGGDAFSNAWNNAPIQSALMVAPTVHPIMQGLGETAKFAAKAPIKATGALANKLMDMTLKQGTTIDRATRQQNTQTALEGGFNPYPVGVDNLNGAIDNSINTVKQGIASGDAAGVQGTLDRAKSYVEALRDQANKSSDPEKNNALIDAEIARLQNHPLTDENGNIPIGDLQGMKVTQGQEVGNSYGEQKPQFQNVIDKARIRGIKDELEDKLSGAFPELAAENKQLGKYFDLKEVLDRAANRIENNQGIGIGLPIKSGSGAAIGGALGGIPGAAVGGAIGTAIGILEHPQVAPRIAQALYRVNKGAMSFADALATTKQRLYGVVNNALDSVAPGLSDELAARTGGGFNSLKNQRGLVGPDAGEPDIMYNPTRNELNRALQQSRYKELRVVKDPATGDIYAADAAQTHHKFIADRAGLNWDEISGNPDNMFIVNRNGVSKAIKPGPYNQGYKRGGLVTGNKKQSPSNMRLVLEPKVDNRNNKTSIKKNGH